MSTARLSVSEELNQQHVREDYLAVLDEAIRKLKLRNWETVFGFILASVAILLSIIIQLYSVIHAYPISMFSGEHVKLVDSAAVILLIAGYAIIAISIVLICYRVCASRYSFYRLQLSQSSILGDLLSEQCQAESPVNNPGNSSMRRMNRGIPFWQRTVLGYHQAKGRKGYMRVIIADIDYYLHNKVRSVVVERWIMWICSILIVIAIGWDIFAEFHRPSLGIPYKITTPADWLAANSALETLLWWPALLTLNLGLSAAFFRRGVIAEALRDILKERMDQTSVS